LKSLVIRRRLALEQFIWSMARRFLLAQQAANFRVTVDGLDLPQEAAPLENKIEFVFPAAYAEGEVGAPIDDDHLFQ
jgi:hypothetical protein